MKRNYLFLIICLFLASIIKSYAYDFIVDNICYNILDSDEKTVEVTYYSGSERIAYAAYTAYTYNKYSLTLNYYYSTYTITSFYSGDIVLPSHVTYDSNIYKVVAIGASAFRNCARLNSVLIPYTITSIGEYAFDTYGYYECSSGNTSQGHKKMTSLTDVTFENGSHLTNIGNYAFYENSKLTSINLPYDLTEIGTNAFDSCTGLNSIYSFIKEPFETESSVFNSVDKTKCTLYVPEGSENLYSTTSAWNEFTLVSTNEDYLTRVTGLSLDKNKIVLGLTNTYQLKAAITPEDATVKNLTYTSSDPSVATVNSDGTITAIGAGEALITATTNDYTRISKTCLVKVPENVYAEIYDAIFDFTCPSTLNPQIEPSEDENTGVNISNDIFTSNDASLTFGLGTRTQSYSAKEYTNNDFSYNLRAYSGATMTFAASKHEKIVEIDFSSSDIGGITVDCGTLTDSVWTGNSNNVTFTINQTNNKISTITVYYYSTENIISDGTEYSNSITLEHQDINYTRTFNNTKWQALYVPFSMSYDDWKDEFDVARINDVHQYDTDEDGDIDETALEIIIMKSGTTDPHTPYLIKAKEAGEHSLNLLDATLYAAEEKSYDVSSWNTLFTFSGTYTGIDGNTMLENGYYALGNGTVHQAESADNSLSSYRWYMTVTDRNGNPKDINQVKVLILNNDNTLTDIQSLETYKKEDGAIYNLSGSRVNKMVKGLYIKNGKKYFVK